MKLYALTCWGCKVETRIAIEGGETKTRPNGWSTAVLNMMISRGDGTTRDNEVIPFDEDFCPACTGKMERLRDLLQMEMRNQ